MSNWNKILCAVDFSDESRVAMEQAATLASRSKGAELTLIHIVSERPLIGVRPPFHSELSAARTEELAGRLEEWRSSAERIAQSRVVASLVTGMPVDAIVRFAREGRYEVLVIGTPGALGCERMVFGSVAEGVIRRAPCSVIVIRRP